MLGHENSHSPYSTSTPLVVCALIAFVAAAWGVAGCAPAPRRVQPPKMQPFVTLKEQTPITRDRAIEIALAEVQRRRPGTVSSAVDALLGVQDGKAAWHISDNPILGGGWTVTVDAASGAVVLCHFFPTP